MYATMYRSIGTAYESRLDHSFIPMSGTLSSTKDLKVHVLKSAVAQEECFVENWSEMASEHKVMSTVHRDITKNTVNISLNYTKIYQNNININCG